MCVSVRDSSPEYETSGQPGGGGGDGGGSGGGGDGGGGGGGWLVRRLPTTAPPPSPSALHPNKEDTVALRLKAAARVNAVNEARASRAAAEAAVRRPAPRG